MRELTKFDRFVGFLRGFNGHSRNGQNTSPIRLRIPDPADDFGMYRAMDAAFEGLHEYLDRLRGNYGKAGYASQNAMSDLSKAYIDSCMSGEEEDMMYLDNDMEKVVAGLDEAILDGELPQDGNRFSKTAWQERYEAELFGKIWPVIIGKRESVPTLVHWRDFNGNFQAYLYGYLDVISELGKAVSRELAKPHMTTELEFDIFRRYLEVAESIELRLSRERHIPNYIISNGWGRWMAYSNKLRTAQGTIAHIRYDYNLRRSIKRMNDEQAEKTREMIEAAVHRITGVTV